MIRLLLAATIRDAALHLTSGPLSNLVERAEDVVAYRLVRFAGRLRCGCPEPWVSARICGACPPRGPVRWYAMASLPVASTLYSVFPSLIVVAIHAPSSSPPTLITIDALGPKSITFLEKVLPPGASLTLDLIGLMAQLMPRKKPPGLGTRPGVMGRPAEQLPDDAQAYRPYLRLSPTALAALETKARKSYRDISGETAMALRSYLDAHKKLPKADDPDPEHARFRPRLPATLVRELDGRSEPDARERHIIAAVEWWVRR